MNNVLVLQCSPHAGGVSDSVANLFTQGMAEAGIEARTVALRDYAFSPCTGCGGCSRPPHKCVLANRPLPGQNDACTQMDQAEEIFQMINEAHLVMISSPVYFYFLPAHFKALIDRTQRFWMLQGGEDRVPLPLSRAKPVLVAMTAGRRRGNLLFSGSLLSLKYFLAPLGAAIRETRLLRGLESLKDLQERPAVTAALHAWGHDWGHRIATENASYELTQPLPVEAVKP
ncbi:MAG: flavodoxin family protein [Desulfovibrio sp.]